MSMMDSPCCAPHFTMVPAMRRSIYDDCRIEEDRHKWIESEKAGRDLGECSIKRWVNDHWWGYLRSKWLEHIHGTCFWIELDRGDYGILQRAFQDQKETLDWIVDRLKMGQENLDIIKYAENHQLPMEPIHQILLALDMNSRRLIHPFESLR